MAVSKEIAQTSPTEERKESLQSPSCYCRESFSERFRSGESLDLASVPPVLHLCKVHSLCSTSTERGCHDTSIARPLNCLHHTSIDPVPIPPFLCVVWNFFI